MGKTITSKEDIDEKRVRDELFVKSDKEGLLKPTEEGWTRLKSEYITSNISKDEMAKKYGISQFSIKSRMDEEHWFALRTEFKKMVQGKMLSKASAKRATELTNLQTAANKMTRKFLDAINDDDQWNRFIVKRREKNEDGTDSSWEEEKIFEKFDTKSMREFTSSLKELTAVCRDLNEIYTPEELRRQAKDAEKWKLEKEKLEAEIKALNETNNPDRTITVEIKGSDLEDYSK